MWGDVPCGGSTAARPRGGGGPQQGRSGRQCAAGFDSAPAGASCSFGSWYVCLWMVQAKIHSASAKTSVAMAAGQPSRDGLTWSFEDMAEEAVW